ncbi:hypothetical protein PSYPI_48173, partial [Pseudomonas syringae pv. pisi str. 1704B]
PQLIKLVFQVSGQQTSILGIGFGAYVDAFTVMTETIAT